MVEHHINTKEDIEEVVRKGINPGDMIVCESEMLEFVTEYMNQYKSNMFFDDIFERSKNRELVCKDDPSGLTFKLPKKAIETMREALKPKCKECGATSNLIRPVDEDLPIYCKPCKKKELQKRDGYLVMAEWKQLGWCCENLWKSTQDKYSYDQGYPQNPSMLMDDRNHLYVGRIDDPIKYCPWCGVKA